MELMTNKEFKKFLVSEGYKANSATGIIWLLRKKDQSIIVGDKGDKLNDKEKLMSAYQVYRSARKVYRLKKRIKAVENTSEFVPPANPLFSPEQDKFSSFLDPMVKGVLSYNAKAKNMSLYQLAAQIVNENVLSKIEL